MARGTVIGARGKRYPAVSLLEFCSVAAGIYAADTLVKRSPISLLKAGTVHPGRFLVLCGGSVASVEEAHAAGIGAGAGQLLDAVFLPDIHRLLHDALIGERRALEAEALGVIETCGPATLLRAVDAAVKGANVGIGEIRLADDLGGRAFALLDGTLTDVSAALDIGCGLLHEAQLISRALIPRLDGNLRRLLDEGSSFAPCAMHVPDGAELDEAVPDASR